RSARPEHTAAIRSRARARARTLAGRAAAATGRGAAARPGGALSAARRVGRVAGAERFMIRRRRGATGAGSPAIGLLALLAPGRAFAHGLDPASLALRETQPGVFEVVWRASALRLPGANVQPALPARCHQIGRSQASDGGDRITLRWTVDCG